MPVQLAKPTRLQLDEGGGDRRGDGKLAGVNNPELSTLARDWLGRVLERVIHV